jgi:hypothetical protein
MALTPHSINASNNFIAGWYLEDQHICDELIGYFRSSNEKRIGMMSSSGGLGIVDKNKKDSTDVTLLPCPLANRYIQLLHNVAREYVALYPFSNKVVPWGVIEPIGIQHYQPGGGYREWHFERDNTNDEIARRHLVFMTYLNDVHDHGGTEFHYQNVTFKPEKGLTLIWPADWTFTHRGVVSPTEHKYIITGWFSTYTREEFRQVRAQAG